MRAENQSTIHLKGIFERSHYSEDNLFIHLSADGDIGEEISPVQLQKMITNFDFFILGEGSIQLKSDE